MKKAKSVQTNRKTSPNCSPSNLRTPQFMEVARELECPEDETAFDRALAQIASAGPLPKHVPKKRTPKKR